jgi:hypothetical protein
MKPVEYRKKPVVIKAIQFVYTKEGLDALRAFGGESIGEIIKHRHPGARAEATILTLEDGEYLKVTHIATEGDYIIQ